MGALHSDERVEFAFVQAGADTRDVLLVTDSAMIRRSPAGTRRIPLVGTEVDIARNLKLLGRPTGVVVASHSTGQVDTLFVKVTGTETMRLSSALAALEAARDRGRAKP